MKRVIKFLENDLPLVIAGTALALSILLAVINAITRYTLSYTMNGSDAIITLCFAYTVYVGSAAAFKRGQHYGVDVLVSRFSEKTRRVVQTVLDVLVLVVMCLGFWLSVQLTMKAGNKTFEGLRLPYTIYDFSAVVGFGYSVLYALEFLASDIKKLIKKGADAA
ncbi:MAG: TRAP transporter small permease subunit [Clostridiales bacterium]|nr:TRAP transporter small permease subunit [Clostridiales bacterium]